MPSKESKNSGKELEEFLDSLNFQEINQDLNKGSLIDNLMDLLLSLMKNFPSLSTLKLLIEMVFKTSLEELLKEDENEEFYKFLLVAYEKNLKSCISAIDKYLEKQKSRLTVDEIILSTLIYQNMKSDIHKSLLVTPLAEFEHEIAEIFNNFLIDQKKDQFRVYFFDWLLKLGYLIEAKMKDLLQLRVNLKCIIEGKNFQKVFRKNKLYFMGNLLKFLNNENYLARYRNVIFHSSFILNYNIDYEERKILFKELNNNVIEFDVDQIVSLFFELTEKIKRFNVIIFFSLLIQDKIKEQINDKFSLEEVEIKDINIIRELFQNLNNEEFRKSLKNDLADLFKEK